MSLESSPLSAAEPSFTSERAPSLLAELARQVASAPETPAIGWAGGSLTYRELDARANQVANALASLGIGREHRVGLSARRSPEALIAVLGIAKAGATCVPLDPSYPQQRLARMVEVGAVDTAIGHEELVPLLPAVKRWLLLDAASPVWKAERTAPATSGIGARELAYVVFTSGSTGQPKGVAVEHGNLANLVAWQRGVNGRRAAVTAQFASLNFDVSFEEIWMTWLTGGRLEIVSLEERRDPNLLWKMLDERGVERLALPFVALEQLAQVCVKKGGRPRALRELITAGETLQVGDAIRKAFDGCRLDNEYGPSETHVVTALALTGASASWPALPAIGRPIANATVHVLDAKLEPAPAGDAGELYLGGAAVGRGYERNPALTAERFLPDPFGAPGARMYKTGDLGRLDGDVVHFLGRADDQIKIRGYRVEPAEIEAVLRRQPGVRDAAVAARGAGAERRLVGYVVGDASVDLRGVRDALAATIPDYMVPAAWMKLASLPLAPSGKLDRRSLPDGPFETPGAGGAESTDAPGSPHEELVVDVWKDVLQLDAIGMEDNFFELGGQSILALQVIARIEERTGVELSVGDVFEFPTPRALAAHFTTVAPS